MKTKEKDLIHNLLKNYLPPHEITFCDVEKNEIDGLQFLTAGVAVNLHSGVEVFGASSSFSFSPLIYAAYECIERSVVLDLKGHTVHPDATFRPALSNGVALHTDIEEAKRNALFELIERNEILKSW